MASLIDELTETVDQVLQSLPDEVNREVIRRRFGLTEGGEQTLEEVAQALEISPEEVERRESESLRQLTLNPSAFEARRQLSERLKQDLRSTLGINIGRIARELGDLDTEDS